MQTSIEVADIFRTAGPAYRAAHAARSSKFFKESFNF